MPRGGYFKLLLYCFTGDRTIEKTGAWAARSHLLRNSLALYRVHVHRSGRKITHTAQFIIQYLPVLVAASSISVVPFSLPTLSFAQNADSHTPQQVVHTRTSLGLDAEHEEDAYFDVEPRHLGRRPGHSLVPEESLYSSSPAVNESRRAFKRVFLSFSGGSSTSDARSFPWLLQRLGDVAAGGRPCLYGAFAACTVASDSPTAD